MKKLVKKKMSTPVETLCKNFPQEFATFITYARTLRFDDKPDYAYLRRLFRDLFIREGYQYDYVYDWTVQQQKEEQLPTSTPGSGAPPVSTLVAPPSMKPIGPDSTRNRTPSTSKQPAMVSATRPESVSDEDTAPPRANQELDSTRVNSTQPKIIDNNPPASVKKPTCEVM